MKLTLYKNCILSNSYSEVFDVFKVDNAGKTAFDRYIETLTKKEIEVENVYLTNSGKFTIDYDLSTDEISYDFNYLKLEELDAQQSAYLTRYAFIDDMTIVNDLVVINYTEDVWTTYAKSMHIRNSLLTRSRVTSYPATGETTFNIPFYAPAMEYEGNNKLTFTRLNKAVDLTQTETPIELSSSYNEKNVGVIAKCQFYQTDAQGEVTKRIVSCLSLEYDDTEFADPQFWENILKNLIIHSSDTQCTINSESYYYEITDVYFITEDLIRVLYATSETYTYVELDDHEYKFTTLGTASGRGGRLITCQTFTLANDFKRLAIGTMLTPIPVVSNGSAIDIAIYYQLSNYDFKMFLGVQNKLVEITKDFKVEIPISVQSADVTQQQASARELAQLNAKLQIGSGVVNTISGVINSGLGIARSIITGTVSGASGVSGGLTQMYSGVAGAISGTKALDIANRPMYSTNKGVSAISTGIVTGVYGIVVTYINADNDTEVQANIDNVGYVCNEIVGDRIFDNTISVGTGTDQTAYNSLRFDFVNLYGKFPQSIARKLRDILLNGIKLYYTENV